MKHIKSHFWFTKGQRNGIFLLLVIIVTCQCVYYFVDEPHHDVAVDNDKLEAYKNEVDSLMRLAMEESKPKIFPFNPNYITDYRGYTLGMTNEEIDRLHKFRDQNKFVNSAKEFQQITKVSDSLLAEISPYFKFPDWINKPKNSATYNQFNNVPKAYDQKLDLNKATAKQLQRVNGIGEVLSERIIKFRNKFQGGFIADIQLQDVYGLSPEVIDRLGNDFTVKTPRQVEKININTATIDQLVTIQHIDYELANEIINQRILREGYKSLNELTKVKGFPIDKLEIIKLYLILEKPN